MHDPQHEAKIVDSLKNFYLGGSKNVTWENREGFMQVSLEIYMYKISLRKSQQTFREISQFSLVGLNWKIVNICRVPSRFFDFSGALYLEK